MDKRTVSVLQLLLTGVLWSIGGLFIKLTDMHPMALSASRSLLASVVILSYLKFKPRFTFDKPQIMGALCYVGTVSLFVSATKATTAANAILLQYGAPVYTAFLAFFILREKIKWYDVAAIAGIAVGMLVFFGDSFSGGRVAGNILAVASGVAFAGQAVCLRMHKKGSHVETILLGNIIAVMAGLPFVFSGPPALSQLAPIAVLGVFQLGIPYVLYSLASKNVTALDLILIPMIEPVLNPIWVFIGAGEKPGLSTVAGGVVIIATVVFKSVCALKHSKQNERDASHEAV